MLHTCMVYMFRMFGPTSFTSLPPGVMFACIVVCNEPKDIATDIEKKNIPKMCAMRE